MIEKLQLKGGISEPSSDILELYDIVGRKRYYYKMPVSFIPIYDGCHKEKGINVCYM